ncbi:unnamed protein product [Miscanthus lutarioriparius]|uniref:Uncharacterized protein n=1 Tax=Miscanthus lutarioriparius TaxID=422564 RepID=A0A811MAR7_9POAL|nr:unnamed protein product [Miscanthus lutarioriparius]
MGKRSYESDYESICDAHISENKVRMEMLGLSRTKEELNMMTPAPTRRPYTYKQYASQSDAPAVVGEEMAPAPQDGGGEEMGAVHEPVHGETATSVKSCCADDCKSVRGARPEPAVHRHDAHLIYHQASALDLQLNT